MSSTDVSALLSPYRDRSSNYGRPEYPLSDHLPMSVAALVAMGAGEDRAATWARDYASSHTCAADEAERAGRRVWRARIERHGAKRTLAFATSSLGDGIGAAAFHAVIRAAYALRRQDDDELACALESWEREYTPIPIPATITRVEAAEALASLARAPISGTWPGLISRAMELAGAHGAFADIATIAPLAAGLDDLTIAAAAAFAQSDGDFTALHVMTATHALRTIRDYVSDIDALMPAFWRAYAAAAVTASTRPTLDAGILSTLRTEAPPKWAPLLAEAIAHDDDHVIKATYTAWCLDREFDDPLFRTTAARFLKSRRPPMPA